MLTVLMGWVTTVAGGFTYVFNVHSYYLGKMIQVDEHMFFKWVGTNHQIIVEGVCLFD